MAGVVAEEVSAPLVLVKEVRLHDNFDDGEHENTGFFDGFVHRLDDVALHATLIWVLLVEPSRDPFFAKKAVDELNTFMVLVLMAPVMREEGAIAMRTGKAARPHQARKVVRVDDEERKRHRLRNVVAILGQPFEDGPQSLAWLAPVREEPHNRHGEAIYHSSKVIFTR
eukprot:5665726-Pleurochrysis_carterae.AAC.3